MTNVENFNLYELPGNPGLLLPRFLTVEDTSDPRNPNLHNKPFSTQEVKLAIEGYTTEPKKLTKVLQRTKGSTVKDPTTSLAPMLGALQNPELATQTDIMTSRDLYPFFTGLSITDEVILLRTQIPWGNNTLEQFLRDINMLAKMRGIVNPHAILWAKAVGQYVHWNQNNCHLLTLIEHPAALEEYSRNMAIPEQMRIMGMLAAEQVKG